MKMKRMTYCWYKYKYKHPAAVIIIIIIIIIIIMIMNNDILPYTSKKKRINDTTIVAGENDSIIYVKLQLVTTTTVVW